MKIGIAADTGDFDKGSQKVKKALKELGVDANSTAGQLVSSFGKATVAFAGVFAAVKAVIAVLNDLKDQNQVLADTWGRTSEGMTAALDSFKTALASLDFSNLISNMAEANRLARELYDVRDAMGEIGTSYNISLASQLSLINKLKLDMANTALSEKERVKAGNQILKIYEELEKNPTRGLLNISDKSLDVMASKLGFKLKGATEEQLKSTRKTVEQFFIWLGTSAGESWNQAYANATGNEYQLQMVDFQARQAGLSKTYQMMLKNYQTRVNDKSREEMEAAVVAYYEQEAKYSSETLKIRKQIQTIINEAAAEAERSAEAEADALTKAEEKAEKMAEAGMKIAKAMLPVLEWGMTDLPSFYDIPQNRVKAIEVKAKATVQFPEDGVLINQGKHVGEQIAEGMRIPILNLAGTYETILTTMGESLGQLAANLYNGEDAWGSFADSALSAFGDLAISIGKIAIEAGLASEGIKEALKLGNPYVAIAAGIALVALGSAIKQGLSNAANGNYSATAGVASSTSSASSVSDYEQRDVYVNVQGTLRADGDQLVAVLQNTNRKNNVTT